MARLGLILVTLLSVGVAIFFRACDREYQVPVKGGVVLSGASTGIGYHAALTLADAGYTVYAGVRKEEDALHLSSQGKPTLIPILLDVAQAESVDRARGEILEDAAARQIPIVSVINNAGIVNIGPVEFEKMEESQYLFDVNVWGAVRLTQAFLPAIRKNHGRVIMISSIASFFTMPRMGTYSASKRALEAYADSLRQELNKAGSGTVTIIQPGAVKSAILNKGNAKADATQENPESVAIYGPRNRKSSDDLMAKADTPDVTSTAILQALTTPRPQTRYVVANLGGKDCRLVNWVMWLLPDRVKDELIDSVIEDRSR